MKAVLAILFIALAVALVSAQTRFDISRTDTREMFREWQDYHVKSYATAEEAEIKYSNFLAAIEHAKKMNAESSSATYGVTMFSDMTIEEWRAKYLMDPEVLKDLKHTKSTPGFVKNPAPYTIPTADGPSNFPEGYIPGGFQPNTLYDWQYGDVVTPVYNQGGCGSCWAFSAMEQIESDHALQHNLSAANLTANGTFPLSAQQLVDCDIWDLGCSGGGTGNALSYVQYLAGGLMTNAEYPYIAQNGNCHDSGPKAVSINGFGLVGQYNEPELLQAVITGGPVSICIDADPFFGYSSGIILGANCGYRIDHCVQLTGYQTDANGNVAAWNIRNQWGTGFGVQGYAMMQYNVDCCGLASYPNQVNAN